MSLDDGKDGAGDPDAEHRMVHSVLDSLLQDDVDGNEPAQVRFQYQWPAGRSPRV